MLEQTLFNEISKDIPFEINIEKMMKDRYQHWCFKKGNQYICSHCGKSTSDEYSRCIKCKVELRSRLIRKNSNLKKLTYKALIYILQKHDDMIMQRVVLANVYIDSIDLTEYVESEEVERHIIKDWKTYIISKSQYQKNTWINGSFNYYRHGLTAKLDIYPDNLRDWLSDTILKNTTIDIFIDDYMTYKSASMIYWKLAIATNYPWIEMLYKAKLKKLWLNALTNIGKVDFRSFKPHVIKRYRVDLQRVDADYHDFCWLNMLKRKKVKFKTEDIKKLSGSNYIFNSKASMKNIVDICKRLDINVLKLVEYLDFQKAQGTYYLDYLSLMEKINTPVSIESTIFPKNLIEAHDSAVNKFNALKHEADNKAYKRRLRGLVKYEYQNTSYSVIVPEKLEDILNEGRILNHCVGSYIGKVKSGETTILFIRRTNELETPFYTLEYHNGVIKQCRGKGNCSPDTEIDEFLKEWKKYVKKPKKRISKSAEVRA